MYACKRFGFVGKILYTNAITGCMRIYLYVVLEIAFFHLINFEDHFMIYVILISLCIMREGLLLSSIYGWRNYSTERLTDLPELTQQVSSQAGI